MRQNPKIQDFTGDLQHEMFSTYKQQKQTVSESMHTSWWQASTENNEQHKVQKGLHAAKSAAHNAMSGSSPKQILGVWHQT